MVALMIAGGSFEEFGFAMKVSASEDGLKAHMEERLEHLKEEIMEAVADVVSEDEEVAALEEEEDVGVEEEVEDVMEEEVVEEVQEVEVEDIIE